MALFAAFLGLGSVTVGSGCFFGAICIQRCSKQPHGDPFCAIFGNPGNLGNFGNLGNLGHPGNVGNPDDDDEDEDEDDDDDDEDDDDDDDDDERHG